jgi:malate dehydrogenase (quinone)
MVGNGKNTDQILDAVLIGAGIMSATLGVMLKELQSDISIEIFERLNGAAEESSDAWNNAGTGHSAFCELNYTPQLADGTVEIKKAIAIAEQFEVSKQFYSFLVKNNLVEKPEDFIRPVPHISFVWGEDNVKFLKERYRRMTESHLFKGMVYSEDHDELKKWMPLVMDGRSPSEKVAATKMDLGTDVNFGSLTRAMFDKIQKVGNVSMNYKHDVKDIVKKGNLWHVTVKDLKTGACRVVKTKFVFIGAGGGSLPLLLKSGIPEGKGFGGFPVSGIWLKCTNPEIMYLTWTPV